MTPVDRFEVRNWRPQGPPTQVPSHPRQVGCWTKTSQEQGGSILYGDESGLLAYKQPQLPADLNEGFPDKYIAKQGGDIAPVQSIIKGAVHAGLDWSGISICTFRNNLNKICLTPIKPHQGWVVDACQVGGTLFLDINKGQQETFDGQELFTYYGYKFEAVCTGQEGSDSVVDATSEFAVLVTLQLGSHRVLMAAEVDCYDPSQQGSPAHGGRSYLELKTYKIPKHNGQEATMYRFKHPTWWVQSFLAGVPELLLGGRTDDGMLTRLHKVPVSRLQQLSREAGQAWDGQQLLSFGEAFLTWLQGVAQRHEGQQVRAEYIPAPAKGQRQQQGQQQQVVLASLVEGSDMAAQIRAALQGA